MNPIAAAATGAADPCGHGTILALIGATTTDTSLRVTATLDIGTCPAGVTIRNYPLHPRDTPRTQLTRIDTGPNPNGRQGGTSGSGRPPNLRCTVVGTGSVQRVRAVTHTEESDSAANLRGERRSLR